MTLKQTINISQCQNELINKGYFITSLQLDSEIEDMVCNLDYSALDNKFMQLCHHKGLIFSILSHFCNVDYIEHIISHRSAQNEWEEDGIWHDDGSRVLAFSLSLTKKAPHGGILELRKKGESESQKITTPQFGDMIVFLTGTSGYEHKINAVTKGDRLIIAGWCYPSITSSA